MALLWVILNHIAERLFGAPYLANPRADWPDLPTRIAQLAPLGGHGAAADVALNLLRYVGWMGDQGVQVFLIVSGLGLTLGVLRRPLSPVAFYRRRLRRLLPLWWGAHGLFGLFSALASLDLSMVAPSFYLSLLGLRLTPTLFYYFSPAWWFVALILQLYLIFPGLMRLLVRRGPLALWALLGLSLLIRGAGLLYFTEYLDIWQRGAFFITRLPEFLLGMLLAHRLHVGGDLPCARGPGRLALLLLYAVGNLLSLTAAGMTLAPLLTGAPIVLLLGPRLRWSTGVLAFCGRHSLALFLVHQPLLRIFLPGGPGAPQSPQRLAFGVAVGLGTSLLFALLLERLTEAATATVSGWARARSPAVAAARVLALGAGLAGALLLGELGVRRVAPQEVLGWGERPALLPDVRFGWRLRPGRTHLRWSSYDYVVEATDEGFPAPAYPAPRSPGAAPRVLTLGDAFTSGEGVGTAGAWPRRLEEILRRDRPGAEVLNFGVTGYGPNQYAAVARAMVPRYRPDVVLIGLFANDLRDAVVSDDDFRADIGFAEPADSALQLPRLLHLRTYLRLHPLGFLGEVLRRRPHPYRYALSQAVNLERGWPRLPEAQGVVRRRLREIRDAAQGVGARTLVLLIPASVQVCGPAELGYYPRHLDLQHPRYDLDLPQRTLGAIAADLGVESHDLRGALQAIGCAYQPWNMHWLPAGHDAAARVAADAVILSSK